MAEAGRGKGVRDAGSKKNPSRIRLKFLTSAVDLQGCPDDTKPEVALIGRSNSGKSTLINGIAIERVAQVSSTPGKTRLLNFFDAGPKYRFVDMPGYGWSARGGDEHRGWKRMIENYLGTRANLCGLLLLMDIRRDWTEDEQQFWEWTKPLQLPLALVLTKSDKLTKNELSKRTRAIREQSEVEHIFVTSSLKKTGFEEIEEFVFSTWVKPRLRN